MNKERYLSETKDDCYYYNYGGDLSFPDRPCYPKPYGARCEFHKKFFFSKRQWAWGRHEGLKPDCGKCREYKKREKIKNPQDTALYASLRR